MAKKKTKKFYFGPYSIPFIVSFIIIIIFIVKAILPSSLGNTPFPIKGLDKLFDFMWFLIAIFLNWFIFGIYAIIDKRKRTKNNKKRK